jgi:hypothetical protein
MKVGGNTLQQQHVADYGLAALLPKVQRESEIGETEHLSKILTTEIQPPPATPEQTPLEPVQRGQPEPEPGTGSGVEATLEPLDTGEVLKPEDQNGKSGSLQVPNVIGGDPHKWTKTTAEKIQDIITSFGAQEVSGGHPGREKLGEQEQVSPEDRHTPADVVGLWEKNLAEPIITEAPKNSGAKKAPWEVQLEKAPAPALGLWGRRGNAANPQVNAGGRAAGAGAETEVAEVVGRPKSPGVMASKCLADVSGDVDRSTVLDIDSVQYILPEQTTAKPSSVATTGRSRSPFKSAVAQCSDKPHPLASALVPVQDATFEGK